MQGRTDHCGSGTKGQSARAPLANSDPCSVCSRRGVTPGHRRCHRGCRHASRSRAGRTDPASESVRDARQLVTRPRTAATATRPPQPLGTSGRTAREHRVKPNEAGTTGFSGIRHGVARRFGGKRREIAGAVATDSCRAGRSHFRSRRFLRRWGQPSRRLLRKTSVDSAARSAADYRLIRPTCKGTLKHLEITNIKQAERSNTGDNTGYVRKRKLQGY